MRRSALLVIAVLALAGCSAGAATSPPPSVSTASKSAATTPTADPADAALRTAVQAYSDAYLSGDAKTAYALLSDRCQKREAFEGFALLVGQAKTLYGNPLPMTSYKAHIADGMARVTYTYTITGINQTDQPWTLAGSGWRDDNC